MAALDDMLLATDAYVDTHTAETALDALDLRPFVHADAFRRELLEHHPGKLRIFVTQRLVGFEHHDAGAEPAVRLGELQGHWDRRR